jgi:mRNA-degrading endonuclease RelE of RelBE toxin-antitoxin system
MSFKIEITSNFKKQTKRLLRKFPSIKGELKKLISSLEIDPKLGTPLGNNCYKIRIAIASKGKGKSGGARILTHIHISKSSVYLLTIYDKSEQSTITENELKELLSQIES